MIVLGRFTFDGEGNLSAKLFTRQPNGSNGTDEITGTYSVSSDCIVTDVWHSTITGADTTHVSVLVHNGKGYYVLNTTDGSPVVISGEAKKQ